MTRTFASLKFISHYLASLKLVSRHDLDPDAPIPHRLRPLWLRSSPRLPSSGFYINILCLFLVSPLKATYLFFLFNYKDKFVNEHRWCVKNSTWNRHLALQERKKLFRKRTVFPKQPCIMLVPTVLCLEIRLCLKF